MLLNENQRVAQLLDLFSECSQALLCVFKSGSTCCSTSALVLMCCQAVSCVVK